jgi:hypothetical protein
VIVELLARKTAVAADLQLHDIGIAPAASQRRHAWATRRPGGFSRGGLVDAQQVLRIVRALLGIALLAEL